MYKVIYIDGADGHKEKEKVFKTKSEAIGFQIVSWYEYHCYKHKIKKV